MPFAVLRLWNTILNASSFIIVRFAVFGMWYDMHPDFRAIHFESNSPLQHHITAGK
jgi:hypothetical protein